MRLGSSRLSGGDLRPGPIAPTVTARRRSSAMSWPAWSPPSGMARRGCRSGSGCSVSQTGIVMGRWRNCSDRGAQPRTAAGRPRLHGGREPADLRPDRVAGPVPARPRSGGTGRLAHGAAGARWGDGDATCSRGRRLRHRHRTSGGPPEGLDFGAHEFVDLENDHLEDVGGVDLVFDVIGGETQKRSAAMIRAGGTLVTVTGPAEATPADGRAIDFVVEADRSQLVRSPSGRGTDGCAPTSAASRHSTMPSRPSTRPIGGPERRSSRYGLRNSKRASTP